jgi:ureidoglycolate hydrolase
VRTIALQATPVTEATFAPFGVLPPDEGDGHPTADLEFTRDDGWVNFIAHRLDEIDAPDGAYRCDVLNRHDTHTQTLMPMTGPAVIVVAPAAADFSNDDDFRSVTAFRMRQYQCVHLHRGTWHWGPYPVGADELRIFNIQGRGYPTDNAVVRFAQDFGLAYDVKIDLD